MKLKYLLQRFWIAFMLVCLFGTSASYGQATLMHSYTFEDGTANDVVGTLHGTVTGTKITIADGRCTVSGATANTDGYIVLDGVALALNTYSAITLEAMVETGEVLNTSYTMLAYFGLTAQGQNCFWIQPTRGANETRIETNNGSSTITAALSGYEVDDGLKHHIAAILTSDALTYYLDGKVIAEASTGGADYIGTLGTEIAQLFKGPDGWADPNYNCSLDEFNIYDGVIDATTMALHIADYLGIDPNDASLASLSTDKGPVSPAFDPDVDLYEIYIPYGTPILTIDAVPTISGATVEMFALAQPLVNGEVPVDETGIDVEIIVTALDGTTEESYFLSIAYSPGEEVATLSAIDLSVGALTEEFNADSTEYNAIVPNGTTSLDVTGVPTWDQADVSGGGTVTLIDGSDTVTITVTSEDQNATKVYTVIINAATISVDQDYYFVHESSKYVAEEIGDMNLNIRLNHAMRDEPKQLFQLKESGVTDQYYLQNGLGHYLALAPPNPANLGEDWNMRMETELTTDLDSCRFWIDEFEPGRFTVQSVSRFKYNYYNAPTKIQMGTNDNNLHTGIYNDKWPGNELSYWNILEPDQVVSPYDIELAELTIAPGSLSPAFDMYVTEYYVTLPVGTTDVTVTATANDAGATVTGAGSVDVSAGEGTITITVTATDPAYTNDYVIHYIVNTPLTLKHSYTFADGTAEDVEGDADGIVMGGSITEGIYSAVENGHYVDLPGADIAINTYPTITVEAYVEDDVNTTQVNDNTMLTYFGNTTGDFGTDYFFTSLKSRAAISCNNTSSPWGSESGVSGTNLHDDGAVHHLVSVVNNDSVLFYIDGTLIGRGLMSMDNKINNISNTFAYLCKSGYTGDPTWMGNVLEYNIYSGEMDAVTVASRAYDYPLEDASTDATLSVIKLDGDSLEVFLSHTLNYDVVLPQGTTVVPTVDYTKTNTNSTAVMTAATELPGTTTIVVTSEDTNYDNTYTVNFSIEKSADASLSDLTVDGTTVDGWDSEVTTYNVVLASGTTTVPTVAGTATDVNAGVVVTDATELPGTTEVEVTAEDGETVITYYVNFIFDYSSDATLSDLTVDGETVEGFDPDTPAYTVVLAQGTTVVPTVDATTTDGNATFVVNAAVSLPGGTTVVVTAEDESTKNYYVNFILGSSARPVEGSEIQVYPTVSDGNFRVITGEGKYHIEIYNITGTSVSETWSYDTETQISTPEAGMYFLKVENKEMVRTFRIIHAK